MSKKIIWAAWGNIDIASKPYRKSYSDVAYRYEFPVDRFNLLDNRLEIDCANIVKAPVYNLTNVTNDHRDKFFNALDQTADEIYRLAGDKIIHLAYSGGVDSTVALCALMRHPLYQEKLQAGKIKVCMNSTSIQEYPELFYDTILTSIPFEFIDFNKIMKDSSAYLVTGDMGDYITASSDILSLTANDTQLDVHSNWQKLIPYIQKMKGSTLFLEMLDTLRQKSIFEISSINQLVWWFSQCLTYQDELARPYIWSTTKHNDSILDKSKVYRFFYSDVITTFSYEYISTNPVVRSYEEGKQWFKEYIVNHTKHSSYLNKTKIYSQRLSLRLLHKSQLYIEHDRVLSDFTNKKL
jgi:hypothetical protein